MGLRSVPLRVAPGPLGLAPLGLASLGLAPVGLGLAPSLGLASLVTAISGPGAVRLRSLARRRQSAQSGEATSFVRNWPARHRTVHEIRLNAWHTPCCR